MEGQQKWARPIPGEMNAPGEEINEGAMKLSPPKPKWGCCFPHYKIPWLEQGLKWVRVQ